MTGTTDIKALREGLVELLDHVDSYGGKCWLFPEDVRSIISSLDQLEAERQRADDCNKSAEYSAATNKRVVAANCRLQEELAALKGDQVPFRYMAEWSSQYGGMEYDYSEVRSEMDEVAAEHDGSVIELFTAPQKPVVWLGDIAIRDDLHEVGALVSYDDVVAAIESAGGIVKDGE